MVTYEEILAITTKERGHNFGRKLSLGLFIREHLKEAGPQGDYAYNIWQEWRRITIEHYERERRKPGKGDSKSKHSKSRKTVPYYLWMLNRLGLVKRVGTSVGEDIWRRPTLRRHYAIVPERLNDPAWVSPREAYDSAGRRG